MMNMLRPYQMAAIEAVCKSLINHRSTLLVLPTGCGKTVCFAKVAEHFRSFGLVLVLAHREELLHQAQEKIEAWTHLSCGIEQADQHVLPLYPPDVVIASVQTLSRPSRLTRFSPDAFSFIIVDEAHHSPANTYLTILRHFSDAKVCGVTATPDRLDKKAMGAVYESVAYVYEIRDAIEQKYLVPIRQRSVQIHSLDLSRVRTTAGDLNEGDLEKLMMEERHLHEVAIPTVELAGDRPTLVFCATIAHARALADVLHRYKADSATSIDGSFSHDQREKTLARFINGEVQFLCNVALLGEGIDIPRISCVTMARPTKSRALYAQQIGRGTRPCPPLKEDLLVLDVCGNAGKHALVSALDILDGNTDLEVKERAQQLCNARDMTIMEALEEAAKDVAAEKRNAILAKARYQAVDVDPFVVLGVLPRAGRWGGAEITDKQVEILTKAKIPWESLDRGQASQVITALFERRQQGLCTLPMAKQLMRFGLNPDVSFDMAKRQLDAIAAAKWRPSAAHMEYVRGMGM